MERYAYAPYSVVTVYPARSISRALTALGRLAVIGLSLGVFVFCMAVVLVP